MCSSDLTLHMFLNICRNLRITPSEFFDFEKREFEGVGEFDLPKVVENTRNILKNQGYKLNRYIKLDLVFLFCDKNKVSIKSFFDDELIVRHSNFFML